MSRRVLIVAGEASGDHHAAGLVREALARDPSLAFEGLTGPQMRAAGVRPLADAADVAVVGFLEVARHLPRILAAYRHLVRALKQRPDLLILVDYPEFNLLLARRARRLGVPVLYFVSPQIWAWRPGRLRTIARCVDRMMVLFRFEEEIYRKAGVPVSWVGHPLAERAATAPGREQARTRLGLPDGEMPVLALLPGSRRGEIERILPVMLGAASRFVEEESEALFLLPVAPTLDAADLEARCAGSPVRVVANDLQAVLAAADAAAVASGTATLEAAVAGTPMVIVYRVGRLTAAIGRRLVSVRDIGLANLVAGRRVAEELVQEDCTPERIAGALRWLLEPRTAAEARAGLALVRERLGEPGAFQRAAEVALEMLAGPLAGNASRSL